MRVRPARSIFYDTEWHGKAQVPIVASTRDQCVNILGRLHGSDVIDERALSYLIDNKYIASTVSFMVRYQLYSVTDGYNLRHYLAIGGKRTIPERMCLLQYGRDVSTIECGCRSVNELVQEAVVRSEVKRQCIIAIRTRAELRLVCVAFLGGLSYGKRSESASLSLAQMLLSIDVDHSYYMMAINEQSVGSMWLQTGRFKDCYKVHLPVVMGFSEQSIRNVGSIIFAAYYTSFVIRGGRYGTRGFLRIVRLFYNSSFFCQESVHGPRLMVCQMKRISPADYSLLYIGHDVVVKVYSGMFDDAVERVIDDYDMSKQTGSLTRTVVSVL